MIAPEVVLEALRVLCTDGVTTDGFNAGISAASIVSRAALQQRSITDLTHLALYRDETCRMGYLLRINLPKDMDEDKKTGKITVHPEDAVWSEEHLDPRFNYDFSHVKDTKTYYRGGEKYKRPCGWQRFALKVLDKFEDNTWLGNNSRTTESVPGEWPVSYHGTQEKFVNAIIEENLKEGHRERYGRGVYSTPDFEIAKSYATKFSCKDKNYKVIMQNRINPEYREKYHNDEYWLVPIEEGENGKEIVKKAIRPYGLLLKQV